MGETTPLAIHLFYPFDFAKLDGDTGVLIQIPVHHSFINIDILGKSLSK